MDARTADEITALVLAGLVVAAGRVGGRLHAAYAAAIAGLGFDFFHVEPIRELHARPLVACLGAYLGVAVLSARRSR